MRKNDVHYIKRCSFTQKPTFNVILKAFVSGPLSYVHKLRNTYTLAHLYYRSVLKGKLRDGTQQI